MVTYYYVINNNVETCTFHWHCSLNVILLSIVLHWVGLEERGPALPHFPLHVSKMVQRYPNCGTKPVYLPSVNQWDLSFSQYFSQFPIKLFARVLFCFIFYCYIIHVHKFTTKQQSIIERDLRLFQPVSRANSHKIIWCKAHLHETRPKWDKTRFVYSLNFCLQTESMQFSIHFPTNKEVIFDTPLTHPWLRTNTRSIWSLAGPNLHGCMNANYFKL